jgi:hypothetical protein
VEQTSHWSSGALQLFLAANRPLGQTPHGWHSRSMVVVLMHGTDSHSPIAQSSAHRVHTVSVVAVAAAETNLPWAHDVTVEHTRSVVAVGSDKANSLTLHCVRGEHCRSVVAPQGVLSNSPEAQLVEHGVHSRSACSAHGLDSNSVAPHGARHAWHVTLASQEQLALMYASAPQLAPHGAHTRSVVVVGGAVSNSLAAHTVTFVHSRFAATVHAAEMNVLAGHVVSHAAHSRSVSPSHRERS